jgi:hypothetical protein
VKPSVKKLTRVKWLEARDKIEERFLKGETEEELAEDIASIEERKPYGIKDELIQLGRGQEYQTPFDSPPSTKAVKLSTEEWLLAHKKIDAEWKSGIFGEEINMKANDLIDVMPSTIGSTLLTRDSFLQPFINEPNEVTSAKPTPKQDASDTEPLSVRVWLGEFGAIEREYKQEGGSEQLFIKATLLQGKRPLAIKSGMMTPSKYKGGQ